MLLPISSCRTGFTEDGKGDDRSLLYNKKPSDYHNHYDSTLSPDENFFSGYIDTFSIGDCSFRILCDPDPGKELLLQKKTGDNWEDNLHTYFGVQGYNREFDVNKDQYPDFVFFNRTDCNAYLYNPAKQKFNFYPVNLSMVFDMYDSSRNIFHQEWDFDNGTFCTQLYRYRDSLLYFMYSAYKSPEIPMEGTQKQFRLYRCENGKMKDTVFLRIAYADSPFSSISMNEFWKKNCPE